MDQNILQIENYPVEARMNYIVGATFDKEGNKDHITAWFNDALHSPGISLAIALNAAFKNALNCIQCSIEFINHPMPYDLQTKVSVHLIDLKKLIACRIKKQFVSYVFSG